MNLRAYKSEDIPAITSLFNQVVEHGDAFLTDLPMTEVEMAKRLEDEQATYVAHVGLKIKGCYMLRPNSKGRSAHVANATYFVSEEFRGTGVGTLLANHSLKTAKTLGYKAMQFNSVVESNKASLNLWKKLGFQIVGEIPNGFRTLENTYVNTFILHKFL